MGNKNLLIAIEVLISKAKSSLNEGKLTDASKACAVASSLLLDVTRMHDNKSAVYELADQIHGIIVGVEAYYRAYGQKDNDMDRALPKLIEGSLDKT